MAMSFLVSDLIEKLKKYPQDMIIEFDGPYITGYVGGKVVHISYNHDEEEWTSPEEVNKKLGEQHGESLPSCGEQQSEVGRGSGGLPGDS